MKCPECNGTGAIVLLMTRKMCEACAGTGERLDYLAMREALLAAEQDGVDRRGAWIDPMKEAEARAQSNRGESPLANAVRISITFAAYMDDWVKKMSIALGGFAHRAPKNPIGDHQSDAIHLRRRP